MSTRTIDMFMNEFGTSRREWSPLLRISKPRSYALDGVLAVADLVARAAERTIDVVDGWHRRNRTYRELSQLDDHLLRDIGLTRDGIPSRIAQLEADRRRQRPGRRI